MGLTAEQIAAVYAAKQTQKSAPAKPRAAQGGSNLKGQRVKHRLIRIRTQFSTLPQNNLVKHHNGSSLSCQSVGCGSPTYYLYRGDHPLCQTHLIHLLVHEINLLSRHGRVQTSVVTTEEPEIPLTSEVMYVSDNDGYL